VLLSLALYFYFSKDTAGRLNRVLDNTVRFSRGQTLNPPLAGNDEIARLDTVFHEMAVSITQAASEKKEFMAMIAHDIRAPLSSISGSLTLLSDERMSSEVSDKAHNMIESCLYNSEQLIQLISDLLDVEKFESGNLSMQFESVPVAFVLENSLNSSRGMAGLRKISLTVPDSEVEIYGDGNRLTQVLMRLLSNAIQRCADGDVVRVELAESNGWLQVSVHDQGQAISPPLMERVFDRFHQIQQDGTSNLESSKLGMAICKQIVSAHYGTIGVESSESKGTAFWFTVPTSETAMNARAPQLAAAETAMELRA
jgi:NtrC-family two-component system sensor histidine kinase KinB